MNKADLIMKAFGPHEPYIECPFCGEVSFGVMGINERSFWRKCGKCWQNGSPEKLPDLSKKLIYLDQFAISNMMFSLNSKLGKTTKVQPFWRDLFCELDRLMKYQLVICPSSDFHYEESQNHDFNSLKMMFNHLSNGAKFRGTDDIRIVQIYQHVASKLGKAREGSKLIDPAGIIQGNYYAWFDRIRIDVDMPPSQEYIDELNRNKSLGHQNLAQVYQRWQQEPQKNFDDWYKEEGTAYGRSIISRYIGAVFTEDPDKFIQGAFSEANMLMMSLRPLMTDMTDADRLETSFKLLTDPDLLEVPSIKLSSLLWASLAHQAAHTGRAKLPNPGMINDIEMVSSILPYVDAIFVDREVYGLLTHNKVKSYIDTNYRTKIFSNSNKQDLLAYLKEIETSAPKELMGKVKEVYGTNWGQPYITMYDNK